MPVSQLLFGKQGVREGQIDQIDEKFQEFPVKKGEIDDPMRKIHEIENEIAKLTQFENSPIFRRAIDQWYAMGMRHALNWAIELSNSRPSEIVGFMEDSENKP